MPFATNQGVKIYYEVEGVGPALILLHGATQDLHHWREFGWVDQLKQDYQLVLIDVRGHGASDKLHDAQAYDLALLAQDVLAVLDQLGLDQAHCCGFSFGGWISFELANLAPHRFYSFVIVDTHPYAITEMGDWARQAFGAGMETYLEQDQSPGLVVTPHFKARKLAQDPEALIASAALDKRSQEDVLPTMTMPCLVCGGEASGFYEQAYQCVQAMPNGRFLSFPGLGHGQMLRYGHQVVPPIKQFLDEITPEAERNLGVIYRLANTINRGDFAALNEFHAADWRCLEPPIQRGNRDIRQLVEQIFSVFGDAEAVLDDVDAEGDQVTIRWTFKGTHTGAWLDIAPTQARVKVSGVTVDRLRDGKIVESSFQYDFADLRRQLIITSEETE
jgi:pimeloyl-ACP methyl ester carboxylesterase/predicted ester cyclase